MTIRGRSQSGVGRSDTFYLFFYYTIPELQILSLEPVTQHGSALIALKQTIFKFNYTLASSSSFDVDVYLKLNKRYWYVGRSWSEDESHYIFLFRETLQPTPDGIPKTAYLFDDLEGRLGAFLPTPAYAGSGLYAVIEVDPFRRVEWADRSTVSYSRTFSAKPFGGFEHTKIVFFQFDRVTQSQKDELIQRLIGEPYWNHAPCPYEVYLSGIFPSTYYVDHVHGGAYYYWSGGEVGWWDADTMAEIAADQGYSRVVAIVPPGALGGRTIGIVYNRGYWWFDDGFHTAFVDHNWSLDAPRYLYFPVVAHELSHTYRFGDIYGIDRQIVVDFDYVYFDEFRGGIIKIFKKEIYIGTYTTPRNVVKGAGLQRLTLPINVSAWDIMDIARWPDGSLFWAQASYPQVASSLGSSSDPPEGLFISMIVYRNGTVMGRPFQKIYNHTYRYPRTDAAGNFSLTLYDRGGSVFRSYPCNISFYYFAEPWGSVPSEAVPLVALVEWTDDLGRIELKDSNGRVWFERSVSKHAPTLEIIYPPEGERIGHWEKLHDSLEGC